MNEIVIFMTEDEQSSVEVWFDGETFWLSLNQIASLFERDKSVISRHLNNIFRDNELDRYSVVAKKATTAMDGKIYQVDYFNLDAILSVGYRVNSRRGTQFRQWATKRLREYLVEGYALNEKRLAEKDLELRHLKDGISILHRAIASEAKSLSEADSLAGLLERFASGLELLDDYDHEELDGRGRTSRPAVRIEAGEYRRIVASMEESFASTVFGREKDGGFDSAVAQIYQSYAGATANWNALRGHR